MTPRSLPGAVVALLVALLVAVPASAAARDPAPGVATRTASDTSRSAAALLDAMAAAMRGLDYQGSFIYEHEGRIDALRVFHAGGAKERERLVGLTGPRSEIVRDGNSVTSIRDGAAPTVFTSSASSLPLPTFAGGDPNALAAHYTLRLAGEDRVAGYRTQRIEVTPRDAYRYGYRLWLERDSHMLLRSIVLDKDGASLEHFMFVALEIGSQPKPGDLLPSSTGKAHAPADEIALDGAAHWRIARLPPGFELISRRRALRAPEGAEHLTWSDGLANASLYIEPRVSTASAPVAALSRGALNIYSSDVGSWRVTALGNVPAATLELLVESLNPVVQPR